MNILVEKMAETGVAIAFMLPMIKIFAEVLNKVMI